MGRGRSWSLRPRNRVMELFAAGHGARHIAMSLHPHDRFQRIAAEDGAFQHISTDPSNAEEKHAKHTRTPPRQSKHTAAHNQHTQPHTPQYQHTGHYVRTVETTHVSTSATADVNGLCGLRELVSNKKPVTMCPVTVPKYEP